MEKRKLDKVNKKVLKRRMKNVKEVVEDSLGLKSLDSHTFDMSVREPGKQEMNLFKSELMAINFNHEDYYIQFNKKLKDMKIPIYFVINNSSATCVGNFVLDKGNILILMEEYAHVVYCTGNS